MCKELLKNYLGANQTCKLQIVSEPNALEGWPNTDVNPTNENVLKLDATGTLPVDDCTFDYVFSEHLMDTFVINNFFRDWSNKFIYDYKTCVMYWRSVDLLTLHAIIREKAMIKTFKVLNEAHGNVIPDEFNELESMVLEGTKKHLRDKNI